GGDLACEEVAAWRRTRPLGRWLRRLWELEPGTRPGVEECLSKYLHADTWGAILRTIAQQLRELEQDSSSCGGTNGGSDSNGSSGSNGSSVNNSLLPPEPGSSLELIPMVGADALVFLYGSLAVKIFLHEEPALRSLMCALEASAPRLLLSHVHPSCGAPALAAQLPRAHACGVVSVRFREYQEPQEEAEKKKKATQLVYVVEDQMQGTHMLYELLEAQPGSQQQQRQQQQQQCQLAAVAEALGDLVGRMHAAASAATSVGPKEDEEERVGTATLARGFSIEAWGQLLQTRGVWHDREGRIWVSGLGCVSDPGGEWRQLKEEQQETAPGRATPAAAAAATTTPTAVPSCNGSSSLSAAADAVEDPQHAPHGRHTWLCEVPRSSRWWPF
ncbi:hypothetical protein Agub_g2202, partial [Astrephomene gubernaculifera]